MFALPVLRARSRQPLQLAEWHRLSSSLCNHVVVQRPLNEGRQEWSLLWRVYKVQPNNLQIWWARSFGSDHRRRTTPLLSKPRPEVSLCSGRITRSSEVPGRNPPFHYQSALLNALFGHDVTRCLIMPFEYCFYFVKTSNTKLPGFTVRLCCFPGSPEGAIWYSAVGRKIFFVM